MYQFPADYKQRVWGGDPKMVTEARKAFWDDTEKNLIPYAVALYSFRHKKKFRFELLDIQSVLVHHAATYKEELSNDEIDTITTHLEWFSRQPLVAQKRRRELAELALELCFDALSDTRTIIAAGHTRCLLELTTARLLQRQENYTAAQRYLERVERHRRAIIDRNQLARVYRKLGMLYRRQPKGHLRGIGYGVRACTLLRVPLAVRLKSAAALVGVDR